MQITTDKSITIKGATDNELYALINRLRSEREAQRLIQALRDNSVDLMVKPTDGSPSYYDNKVSTEELVNDLYHHGILGMKWGVRKSKSKIDSDKNSKIKQQRKKISEARRLLTEKELQDAINRLQNEKKLKELTEEDVAPGKTATQKILKQIGKTAITAAGGAVATYSIKALLEGKFDVKEAAKFIRPRK